MGDAAPEFERMERNGATTLVITGEVDLACADELRAQLRAITSTPQSTGVVDLSGVTFLDSSGLGVLIAAKKLAVARDADLALSDPSPACRNLLEVSGADQYFEIRE